MLSSDQTVRGKVKIRSYEYNVMEVSYTGPLEDGWRGGLRHNGLQVRAVGWVESAVVGDSKTRPSPDAAGAKTMVATVN
jgi:hypothetical protein